MINFIQGNGMIPIYGKMKLNMWESDCYEATQCVDMINFIQGNGMIPIYGKKKLNMWKNKRSGKDIEWENRRMDISHYSALAVKDSGLRTDANNVQQLCRW